MCFSYLLDDVHLSEDTDLEIGKDVIKKKEINP